MKKSKKQTWKQKVRGYLSAYSLGVDPFGAVLAGLFLLPNLVWWCYSPRVDQLRGGGDALSLYIAAFVFLFFALAVLVFVKREDRIVWDSPFFLFTVLGYALYLAAWIFYFCSYINFAVYAFFGVFPAVSLVCAALLRKNYLALAPAAVFAILNFASNMLLLIPTL